jgi:hypothetical protein
MADYHVLHVSRDGDQVTVAFHIPVPAETNTAGRNLSDCLVEDQAPATEVPYLDAPGAAEVAAGTVYEHIITVAMSAHSTNPERIAALDAKATALQAAIPDRIRKVYSFWGYERTVP